MQEGARSEFKLWGGLAERILGGEGAYVEVKISVTVYLFFFAEYLIERVIDTIYANDE